MKFAEQTITLTDGRELAVIDQGPTEGTPVLYLHGTPGANKDHIQHEAFYQAQGLRLISVNRPGTGSSSYDAHWGGLSFADDLKQVLDNLGIGKATVVGFSSGGLYACAFARSHPGSVSKLGLLASVGPFDIPVLGNRRSEAIKQFHETARNNPAALLEQLSAITSPEAVSAMMRTLISSTDQDVLSQPDIAGQLLLSYADVLAQGMGPLIADMAIVASPWGFAVADIEVDTYIWHGTADINVPIECSEYLAEQIPSAKATYIEGAGHYFSFAKWEQLLQDLAVQ